MGLSVHDRIQITESFLLYFPGNSIFVSKHDPADKAELEEIDKKPWHYHGLLEDHIERLIGVNNPTKARGIFFAVNDLDQHKDRQKKRTNKMWTRSRAVWCEDDNQRSGDPNDFRNDWPLVPNLVVNTSPGKFHYYWLTDVNDPDRWAEVQNILVEKYGSDNSAKDLARVLRLPGFFHLKDVEKPHFVNFIVLKQAPYKWSDIEEGFGVAVNGFGNEESSFNENSDFSASDENPNTSEDTKIKRKYTKSERVFIRKDTILDVLTDMGLVKEQLEPGLIDITCPWLNEHTDQDNTGTRLFLPNYNGYDQHNFKCNHAHCANRTLDDLLEKISFDDKIRIPKHLHKEIKLKTLNRPKFPVDFMKDWPEPWPLIWDNWKRIPRELSQPLLTPTILSLHAYILNSKYVTDWGRRPNLYQLNLAESTANKDTNSKDVLRAIGQDMLNNNVLNTIFDTELFDSDSNITSDTAFLKTLEYRGGKFYWLNTEATRVFQQLNSSSGSNTAVMALSDKMIEVVDGHGITAKSKADNKIPGCDDPNIQIVFYAQPETIEKYISEEMVDSGFLGRAIITLDDKSLVTNKPQMFIKRTSINRTMDDKLMTFYSTRSVNAAVKETYVACPDERGMEELIEWSENFVHPILDHHKEEQSHMYKMISRIGNTAEQLYAIILGICREWDFHTGKPPREASDISPSCMFPLLEFWTKSKEYVVKEYICIDSDPLAQLIESVLFKLVKGKIKTEKRYATLIKERGLVPRSILLRSIRGQKRVFKKLNLSNDIILPKINMVLDSMVSNDLLREEWLVNPAGLTRRKKTRWIGFV